MPESDPYFLGYRSAEQDRLRRQAEELAGEARWLLDQCRLAPGARAIDVGCGPQGILDLLAERVGPTGSVVGLERGEEAVGLARAFVAERRLANVEVVQGDAKATGFPRGAYDLAHARLVLVNVPEPAQVIAELVALVRPGGMVASHEADYVAHLCDPPLPAWTRLLEILETYSRLNGIDLFVGRRVHGMLRAAGLVDVHVHPVIHVYPPGHGRRWILLDFVESLRDRLLAQGVVTETELSELMASLRQHLQDPGTLVVSHLFFQTWGRKPA